MLALQCIASHRWSVRSFDIRTAFLRGSRQDGRILGMEPPPELRLKMKLQDSEVCELLKGAYGLFNAPLLWYCELKNALLGLGFVMSPFDPCLFTLPKKNPKKEECQIHGVLGIHVDDGIGGGDHVFNQTIATLEKRFPFGTQRQRKFHDHWNPNSTRNQWRNFPRSKRIRPRYTPNKHSQRSPKVSRKDHDPRTSRVARFDWKSPVCGHQHAA